MPKLVEVARPVSVPSLNIMLPVVAGGVPEETLTLSGTVAPMVTEPGVVEVAVTLTRACEPSTKDTVPTTLKPVPVAETLAVEVVSNKKPVGTAKVKAPAGMSPAAPSVKVMAGKATEPVTAVSEETCVVAGAEVVTAANTLALGKANMPSKAAVVHKNLAILLFIMFP